MPTTPTIDLPPEHEAILLHRLANGCPASFNAIYEYHQPRLQLYIYRLTARSKHLSDDIIQEVFIRLWLKRKEIRVQQSLGPYLQKMAKNRLIDHLRSAKTNGTHLRTFAASQSAAGSPPEDELQLKEYHKVTGEAVSLLPARRSSIFQLNVMQGYSLDDVSNVTGLSKEVVKKQLFKAKRFILKHLQTTGGMTIPSAMP